MSVSNSVSIQPIRRIVSSNMLAGLMLRPITWRLICRVVGCDATLVVRRCIRFVRFASCMNLSKSLFTPESQRHQSRHIERGHSGGDESYQPQDPSASENAGRECLPQNFVF